MSTRHMLLRKKLTKKKTQRLSEPMSAANPKRKLSLRRDDVQKTDREGYLKIGDIISLKSKEDIIVSGNKVPYSGMIFGDGIAYTDLQCIPKQLMFSKNQNIQFRQSLFRVEPAHQYGFVKHYNRLKEQKANNEELIKYKQKAEEEEAANDAELEMSYGRTVTYGERIQLRHLHSNYFVTTAMEIAQEHGCLKVILVDGGNEASWIEIIPRNKLRQEGEPIRYIDKFLLCTQLKKSKYHFNMAVSTTYNEEMPCELNASDNFTAWKALKYISYTEIKKNPLLVASGDSFTIFSENYGGYLSVSSRDISEILPPDLDFGTVLNEEDAECMIYLPKHWKKKSVKVDHLKLFIESELSGRCLWELERINPFIGGIAMTDECFRIKHVGTGMYLEISRIGNISLKPEPMSDFNIFQFNLNNPEVAQLNFNSQLRIQSKFTLYFLGTKPKEEVQTFLSLHGEESDEKIPIRSYLEDNTLINTTFVLIDVPEISTLHIYQISRIVPKVLEFYSFLREWGMLNVDGIRWVPDYDLALVSEPALNSKYNELMKILLTLNKKLLQDHEGNFESVARMQETIRDTGLLDLFLKLSMLINKRLVMKNISGSELPKAANLFKNMITRAAQTVKGPDQIAEKYLVVLIKQLYLTIYNCIKNNPKNCELLKNYDEFLSYQLRYFKSEISQLLKETFKHSVDIMNKISIKQFGVWADQIAPINQLKSNIIDQTLVLMILSSFCMHKDKGLQKYQSLIEGYLFSAISDTSRIKLLDFITINSVELIGFLPGDEKLDIFIENNPLLNILYADSVIHPISKYRLIPLTLLTTYKEHIKYVCSILELLSSLCLSRYESVKPKIQEIFEITPQYVIGVLRNQEVHLKIRTSFMKLARVLYLDIPPIQRISKNSDRCVFWSQDILEIKAASSAQNIKFNHFPISQLVEWVVETWIRAKFPSGNKEYYKNLAKLKFTIELLRLTNCLIDLGYADFDFFIAIYPSLVRLIFDYSTDSIIKAQCESHWCRTLKIEVNSFSSEKNNSMIKLVLKIFKTASHIRKNKELELLINCFRNYLDSGSQKTSQEIAQEFIEISAKFDFSNALLSSTYYKQRNPEQDNQNLLNVLPSINFPENPSQSFLNSEHYQLDSCLLGLLFKNSQKSIEVKALNLILDNFNQRKNLLKALEEVYLLYSDCHFLLYRAMKYCITYLCNLFDRIINEVEKILLANDKLQDIYQISYVDNIVQYTKSLKSLLSISQPREHLKYAQGIARNLGLHDFIIKFLMRSDLPWIVKGQKRVKISPLWKDAYKGLIHVLFAFTFKSSKNQLLIYPKLTYLVFYFGNGIGATTLISEILSSQKDNAAIEKIIAYIFSLFSMNKALYKCPHDLKMLLNLIVDEKKKIKSFVQINVIKALVSSPAIMDYYTKNMGIGFTNYNQEDVNFHSSVVLLLAYCCVNNEFAIKQCQRLLPYNFIMKEILSNQGKRKLKRAYLHFFAYAYMNSDITTVDYNKLEDLFNTVVIPDLINYRDYIEFLPFLAIKEAYKTVSFRKEIRIEPADQGYLVREYLDDDEVYEKSNDPLTEEEAEALDYWKFLINAKPWKIELVTGLLIFIHDLCIDMKTAKYTPNNTMQAHLGKVIELIIDLKDSIQILAEQHPRLNFEFLLDTISISMSEIPTHFNVNIDQTEIDNELYKNLIRQLADLTKAFGMTAEKFVRSKLKVYAKEISANDLTVKCKGVLTLDVRLRDIYRGLRILGENIDVENFIDQINANIKTQTFKRAYSICIMEPEKIMHFNSRFRDYVNKISGQIAAEESYELTALVSQVKANIIDVALNNKDFSIFYKFTRNLELAFSNPEHKVYLIEIFRQMILKERNSEELKNMPKEKINRVRQIQKALISANIAELCLRYLVSGSEIILVSKSLKLMHQLLEDCEVAVKEAVLSEIKNMALGIKIFTFIRTILNEVTDKILQGDYEKNIKLELCFDFLLLLRLMCSECYEPAQLYLQEQNDDDQRLSLDIVSEIAKFTFNLQGLKEIKNFENDLHIVQQLVIDCFNTLTSFCQGPCIKNQVTAVSNKQIYTFINWVSSSCDGESNAFYRVISSICLFLLSILEGDTSEALIFSMLNNLKVNYLLRIATNVYLNHIKLNTRVISQENSDNLDPLNSIIINLGFNITIIFLKFQDRFPQNPRVKTIFIANSEEIHENVEDTEAYNYQEAIVQNIKSFWQKFRSMWSMRHEIFTDYDLERLKEAHFYYTSNIGSVEISFRKNLCKLFFRIPPMCKYLTRKSRQDIFLNVKRNSHQEKIEDFFDKSKIYEFEMKYQQYLGRYPFIEKLVSHWNFYGFLAFASVITINLTILLYYDMNNYTKSTGSFQDFLIFCGVIQIISAILYFLSYTIEYFPVIKQRELIAVKYLDHDTIEKYQRVRGTLLMKELLNKSETIDANSVNIGLRFAIKDFQLMYCLIYLIISIICWYNELLYSILLLDLIKRNDTLINILKSISLNYKQILLTLLLALFIVFIYSTIYMIIYSGDFNADNKYYCDTFSSCFFTILNSGVRAGGGIGDILNNYTALQVYDVIRIIFDLSFFVIVIIVLLNIIFGIIIDTFAELRDQRNEILQDLQQNCFICGNTRFQFEIKRISWKLHVHLHHSLHSYLAFIVYIRQKEFSKCNGVEKYTKEKIQENDVSFFPRSSISLQKYEEEFKDTQTKIYMKYIKKLNDLKASLE